MTKPHMAFGRTARGLARTGTFLALLGLAVGMPGVQAGATNSSASTFVELSNNVSAGTCADGDVVTIGTTITNTSGDIAVGCDLTIDLNGNPLTLQKIFVNANKTLTIQATGGGTLTTNASLEGDAGINVSVGSVVIKSGTIVATGGSSSAGIGGGNNQGFTSVEIQGGDVTANAGSFGAGIGGRSNAGTGAITISGGTVHATGADGGAGIGAGQNACGLGTVTISGGTVTASGAAANGPGIGVGANCGSPSGSITISGGTVNANGGTGGSGYGAAGIGSGFAASSPAVTISGGTVVAIAGNGGAGIGTGPTNFNNGKTQALVTISGGDVTATGGTRSAEHAGGAGVGGGYFSGRGPVTITGGQLAATGGEYAAGIGGGDRAMSGAGAVVSITNAAVTAIGSASSAGIGGGARFQTPLQAGSDVTIGAGAVVTASGGATAIGGGSGFNNTYTPNGEESDNFGSLSIVGKLRLGSNLVIPNSASGNEVTIASTGSIDAAPPATPKLFGTTTFGSGSIDNGGSITLPTADIYPTPTSTYPNITVLDHNYLVSFDSDGGSSVDDVAVFAATFANGNRTLPTPTKSGFVFTGWTNSTLSTGVVTSATSLTPAGGSVDGTAIPITLTATWAVEPTVSVAPSGTTTVEAGETVTFTATATGDPTPTIQWQVDTGSGFTDLGGETAATLEFTAALGDDGNLYRAVATSTINTSPVSVNSNSVTLAVTPPTSTPTNVTLTGPSTVLFGNAVGLVATVSSSSGTPTGAVQFRTNNTDLGSPVALRRGRATFSAPLAMPGQSFTAVYIPTNDWAAGSATYSPSVAFTGVVSGGVPANLNLTRGSWLVSGADVRYGSLSIGRGVHVLVTNSTFGGNVGAVATGTFVMCGSTVGGNLLVSRAGGMVVIGNAAEFSCASNTLLRYVSVSSNSAGIRVGANAITGSLSVKSNNASRASVAFRSNVVSGNTIGGNLDASANRPVATNAGSPNTVARSRSGEGLGL